MSIVKIVKSKRKIAQEKDDRSSLKYKCQKVLEFYAYENRETLQLERLGRVLKKEGIAAEIFYTHHSEISYATLVIFLPWQFHAEISKFSLRAFKHWHEKSQPNKILGI